MDKEKKKFPIGPEHYTLHEEIGEGVSASVYRALCLLNNEIVAIKILDFERCNSDLKNISREAQTMFLVDHANVLKSHCSFVSDHTLWVVMPYMAGGSCLHILKAAHPEGFEEVVIATILREVLKGLEYLHSHGHIHRDVKAGNILIGSRGAVKLGDLGVSTCLFDSGDRQRTKNTFVGTPCWMAPEVMEQSNGYDFKADIWSFGITALELAHGHAPFSKYPPMKVLLMTIQYAPPSLNYERDKKFSKSFKQMIASCLVKDPSKRPTVKKLMKHAFFKQARSNEYITRTLLDGLPSLGDRIKALKKKEEDMLAQKKMAYGEKEELSQSEYKRGISTWNFNLEDMKAQASLIPDDDNLIDKENGSVVDCSTDCRPQVLDNISEEGESSSNGRISKTNSQNSSEDLNIASPENDKVSSSQCCSSCPIENIERNVGESLNNVNKVSNNEGMRKMVDKCSLPLHSRRVGSSPSSFTLDIPTKTTTRVESFKSPKHREGVHTNEGAASSQGDETMHDTTPRTSMPSPVTINVDEIEERVIQIKGRFQVTKGDQEKVTNSIPTVTLPSPTSERLVNHSKCLFSLLQSILQANSTQRENLFDMLKQISSNLVIENCSSDRGCTHASISTIEKSLLEVSQNKEKELHQEITMLQSRINRIEEEFQKYKITINNNSIKNC